MVFFRDVRRGICSGHTVERMRERERMVVVGGGGVGEKHWDLVRRSTWVITDWTLTGVDNSARRVRGRRRVGDAYCTHRCKGDNKFSIEFHCYTASLTAFNEKEPWTINSRIIQ